MRRQIAYGARARRAVGRERERVQPARPAPHLSVPRVRRARPRAQARARPRPRRRAVRLGARARWSTRSARCESRRAGEVARSAPTGSATRSTTRGPTRAAATRSSRNYMAHHVGMSLVALTNALTGQLWQRRFHADPLVRVGGAAAARAHSAPARAPGAAGHRAPDEALPDPELERPVVREFDTPGHAAAARRAARPPAVHDHGQPLRRRVQPLRGPRGHALARRRHHATPPASSAT